MFRGAFSLDRLFNPDRTEPFAPRFGAEHDGFDAVIRTAILGDGGLIVFRYSRDAPEKKLLLAIGMVETDMEGISVELFPDPPEGFVPL